MARISVKSVAGRYWITLRGRVSGRDLGRLERLCGPALEQERLPLTLCLKHASVIDGTARRFFEQLAERGAELTFE
jgi:hypothetical protein